MKVSTLLIVKDLKQARKFYVQLMGLSVVAESNERLDLAADGHEIHVFEGDELAKPYSHSSDAGTTLVF